MYFIQFKNEQIYDLTNKMTTEMNHFYVICLTGEKKTRNLLENYSDNRPFVFLTPSAL